MGMGKPGPEVSHTPSAVFRVLIEFRQFWSCKEELTELPTCRHFGQFRKEIGLKGLLKGLLKGVSCVKADNADSWAPFQEGQKFSV
jgi:hypothetical protein